MPTLELTLLHTTSSPPPSTPTLVTPLTTVRTSLAQHVHPTHSRFYRSLSAPTHIYILGLWPSIAHHQRFLADPELRERVLAPQEGIMTWAWGVHVDFPGEEEEWRRWGGVGGSGNGNGSEGRLGLVGFLRARVGGRDGVERVLSWANPRMGEEGGERKVLFGGLVVTDDGDGSEKEVVVFLGGREGEDEDEEAFLRWEREIRARGEEVINVEILRDMES